MSERKDTEPASSGVPASDPAAVNIKSEMAHVESPPLAPQIESPQREPAADIPAPAPDTAAAPAARKSAMSIPVIPALALSRRAKRRSLLAATVLLATGIGAVIGSFAGNNFGSPPAAKPDGAAIAEQQATKKQIAQLTAQIATLKTNIESANRNASTQIAKITDRFERAARPASAPSDTTGSIPLPRPAPGETAEPAKPAIVQGWIVREARDGIVLVEGHGEIYQVVPGAPLPGLGRVESIKRQDGRWIVVTPKGIITSMRMRPVY